MNEKKTCFELLILDFCLTFDLIVAGKKRTPSPADYSPRIVSASGSNVGRSFGIGREQSKINSLYSVVDAKMDIPGPNKYLPNAVGKRLGEDSLKAVLKFKNNVDKRK